MDRLEAHGPSDPERDILDLAARDALDLESADRVLRPFRQQMLGASVAPAVGEFVTCYAEQLAPSSVLDAWAGFGLLVREILRATPARAVAITPQPRWADVGNELTKDFQVQWVVGGLTLQDPERPTEQFDLVVGLLPWGRRRDTVSMDSGDGRMEVRDRGEALMALSLANSITARGRAIFLLPNSFFTTQGGVWERLEEFGLYPSAVVGVPFGGVPGTGIVGNIVILQREPIDDLFVGVIERAGEIGALVTNLVERRPGEAPSLGRIVKKSEFRSWEMVLAVERYESRARVTGLNQVRLADIASDVSRMTEEMADPEQGTPVNAVFLNLYAEGAIAATTNPEALLPRRKGDGESKRKATLQAARIVLNPDRALAEYVVTFFGSELGKFIRTSFATGATIQRIPFGRVPDLPVYLPPVEEQRAAQRIHDQVRDVRSRLAAIEQILWENPSNAAAVGEEVARLAGGEESFERWLEELPFPLASILWRYHADLSPQHKVEHLLHFFEALAQFSAVVLLSAFRANETIFEEHKKEWLSLRSPLSRPTFGTWKTVSERVAETARELAEDQDRRAELLLLFNSDRDSLLRGLIDPALHGALATALRYRNDWKGHDALVSDAEIDERLRALQRLLSVTRNALGGAFLDWLIVKPGDMRREGQLFQHRVEVLMGRDMIFRSAEVSSTIAMDSNQLYLLDALQEHPVPVELIPFMRIKASPGSQANTCYFYNRIDEDRVRLVSYHFEQEADIRDIDPEIVGVVEELSGR